MEWDNPAELPIKLGEEPRVEEWWACPRRPVLDDPRWFTEVVRLWTMREKGFLPYPGSYLEQPNVYVEVMAVFDAAVAEINRIEDTRRQLREGRS